MITHFPPWRQGLGLQSTISKRKEHKQIKISQRMNEWLNEERKEAREGRECGRNGIVGERRAK